MPVDCSHEVASARRDAPIELETQVPLVPEPSESRYWCISSDKERNQSVIFQCNKSKYEPMATLSLGSVSASNAAALPLVIQAENISC